MYDYRPVPQYDIEYRFSTFQLLYFEIKGPSYIVPVKSESEKIYTF
jgi:hypothetical protein